MSPTPRVQFRMRVYRGEDIAIGPGKIALLEALQDCGSITAAAQRLGMSYRRAWVLVEELNRGLRDPAVVKAVGGAHGGGSVLTDTGRALIAHYRAIDAAAHRAAASEIAALTALLAP